MNILQILPEINVGGVETGVVDLARQLVKLGHRSVVISNGGSLVKELESNGAVHYQLPVHKKSLFSILQLVKPVCEIINKEKIDIVHARSRVPAWIAFFAARRTNRIFITTCHGFYKRHIFSYVMGWAKMVICPSQVIARHMIDDFLVPQERIRLIPRGVHIERFEFFSPAKKRQKEFNVGIIARLSPIKGHIHFIKAMAELARSVPNLKIWIVGDASVSRQAYKEQIQVLVKRLGLWDCTQFLGTQRDIPQILRQLDLLVVPTLTQEAFGRVIIEAQASGVPVIASRIGGIVDIIDDNKTGLLVPVADPTSISQAGLRVFKDKEFADRLAQAAFEKVKERYSLELMVENTIKVYEEAAKNYKILIIKLSSLGDVILSSLALRAIREKFGPNYSLTLLTGNEAKEAVLTCPYIDELLVADFKNKDKGLAGIFKIGNILRKKNFDIVIDLQNNRLSHTFSFLSAALNRYGYDNKKFSFLLNRRIKDQKPDIGPVEHQFRILNMLGIALAGKQLELWPTQRDIDYVDEFLRSQWISPGQKIVGINLNASAKWETKSWPLQQVVKLCEALCRQDIRVIVTGREEDRVSAENLQKSLRGAKIINACSRTSVNQLACLIKRCNVYISADSAPLHIAAAMGTAFIALFGPTSAERHLPPAEKYIVIRKDLPCSPCYKPKCKTKQCMESITVGEVLEAIEKLI